MWLTNTDVLEMLTEVTPKIGVDAETRYGVLTSSPGAKLTEWSPRISTRSEPIRAFYLTRSEQVLDSGLPWPAGARFQNCWPANTTAGATLEACGKTAAG